MAGEDLSYWVWRLGTVVRPKAGGNCDVQLAIRLGGCTMGLPAFGYVVENHDQIFKNRFSCELLQLRWESGFDGGGIGWTGQHCHGDFLSEEGS